MNIKMKLMSTATAFVVSLGLAGSAFADVSIMYPDWMASLVEPGIEMYEKKTGETVESIKLPGNGYDTRVAVDLASGTAADVAVVDSFMVAELASVGYLEALDVTLADWDQFKYYVPGLLDVASYKGHVYALNTDTDVRMLWYDKSVFAKAGIEMPWAPKSWDDVIDTAVKVKEKAGVDYAFVLPAGTKQGEAATMQGFYMALLGADTADNERNRLRNWAEAKWIGASPALTRTVNLYDEVYNQKKLTDPSINYATDIGAAVREALANDNLGILASGSWEWACLFDCNGVNLPSEAERRELIGWAPWPNAGVDGAPKAPNVSGGWAIGLNANASDKAAGVELLTTIFDNSNFESWTVKNGKMAVRTDISESAAYKANAYLAKATLLAEETTGRDTFPGYQIVSSLVQDMTGAIIDGVSPEVALQEYHDSLVSEFGEDNVMILD